MMKPIKYKCNKCDYTWQKKTLKNNNIPKCCPLCKSYQWAGK